MRARIEKVGTIEDGLPIDWIFRGDGGSDQIGMQTFGGERPTEWGGWTLEELERIAEAHQEFRKNADSGTSDGYHTFDELYHFRMLYNAAFFNQLAWYYDEYGQGPRPVKSYRHADGEPCFGKENYFVVVAQLPEGQVSNHYHGKYWNLFQIDEVDRAPEWDGHTPIDAIDRMTKYLRRTA